MKLVIKVGTSTLAHTTGRMNIRRVEELCKVLSDIKNMGHDVILVTSGAIGMGVGKLSLSERPKDIPTKQAAAAVGQCELMYVYDRMFTGYNHNVAQILLTADDFRDPTRLENFRNTIKRLLELHVLPIINENDSVITDEIKVGDNDTLSALVATDIGADELVILSDIDGLYNKDPKKYPDAKRIDVVTDLTEDILACGGDTDGTLGTGGMKTKLHAAQICMDHSCNMWIVNGDDPSNLYLVLKGTSIGTRFLAK